MLANSGHLFFSGHLTTPSGEISLSAVKACAEVIYKSAALEENGFANLRFAALANVPPYAPFFPAVYSEDKTSGINLNVIAPGPGATNFHKISGGEPRMAALVDNLAKEGKTTTPEDIAHVVAFLVSDVSSKLSGQVLEVSAV